jgi:acyl-CoA thioesterase-2
VGRVFAHFADMLAMAPHGPDVWVGESADYPWGRVYGGQVAAQGFWAATHTVDPRFRPHSLHVYFIRGGDSDEPIRYEVDRIRDGRSFATRRVVARQSGGAILNLSASFHVAEDAPDVTRIALPAGLPEPESLDSEPAWSRLLDHRDVPDSDEWARAWLKVEGPLGDDPVVHLAAHVYASDDIPMEAVVLAHPLGPRPSGGPDHDNPYMAASLDHAVWFHRFAPADEWTLHEARSPGVAGGRGISFGEIWSRDGIHVASVAQEVVLRVRRPSPESGGGGVRRPSPGSGGGGVRRPSPESGGGG